MKAHLYFTRQDELDNSLFCKQKFLLRYQGRLIANWFVI